MAVKALVPYAILGVIGAGGAFAGFSTTSGTSGATPPVAGTEARPTPAANGPVIAHAALERTVLPVEANDVFARIALEGRVLEADNKARTPVSLTLVIDRSGSMAGGTKMRDAVRAAKEAIAALRVGDKVCVVSFDDGAELHGCASINAKGTQNDDEQAPLYAAIERLHPRGGTDMIAGIDVGGRAAKTIHGDARVNRILLLSDGHPNVAEGLKEQAGALAKQGVQTTTLGLGSDYNEDLMASIADAGLGHYYFVAEPAQLAKIFHDELESLASIVAREATVHIVPKNGITIAEVIGFNATKEADGSMRVPAGDIYGGRVTDVLVRLAVPAGASSTNANDVVTINVAYTPAAGGARMGEDRVLVASRSTDAKIIASAQVAEVAVKVEKFHAANAWLKANEAYDRGDKSTGDSIMSASAGRLAQQAQALGDADLAKEASEQQDYKLKNEQNGAAWRGVGTREAKKKAWSMNKGSAY
jgi:Ca-activated chloride channel homolog